jgi:hypothetical protein
MQEWVQTVKARGPVNPLSLTAPYNQADAQLLKYWEEKQHSESCCPDRTDILIW